MAYKVIILYQLYMPSYFLGTFTEYPYLRNQFRNQYFFPFPLARSADGIKTETERKKLNLQFRRFFSFA